MLIVWSSLLVPEDQLYLRNLDPRVVYWPASYMRGGYNHVVPIEWWISFSSSSHGLMWLMGHSQFSRVVYSI